VPMLTCGLLRSNFAFAMMASLNWMTGNTPPLPSGG
jgi:hypothetical protein